MINKITLKDFKNVSNFDAILSPINILIGANNSGKSSVLQGIHFSIMAEVIRRKYQKLNIAEDLLLYLPSSNFLYLRHNQPYTVSSGFVSSLYLEDDSGENFFIEISKGRNDKNISVSTNGNSAFRQTVTTFSPLYSIYVPGISGIPIKEKYVTKAELRSAVARGDANMYIRNILYCLSEENKLASLNSKIHKLFPDITVNVPYNPNEDLYVSADIVIKTSVGHSEHVPLEQCGTGMLQIIQILAYTLYFSPHLLLLDEPDEHLHPSNQMILAELLQDMVENQNMQIILCTHSRHLLSALSNDSNIIWMKDGQIIEQNASTNKYDILLDIGALDIFDQCLGGQYKCIFLTEDSDIKMCKLFLDHNGFKNTLVFPFKGCGNTETAILLANFIHNYNPNCLIVIHRDRDFMQTNEVSSISAKLTLQKIIPFITDGSDIEAYFTNAKHLAYLLNEDEEKITLWIENLIKENQISIITDFINKRHEFKNMSIYKRNDSTEVWQSGKDLIGEADKISIDKVKGKFLKKKILGDMHKHFGKNINIFQDSPFLDIPSLKAIAQQI